MAGHNLMLLGSWASPFSMRVKLALTLKGLSYDNVQEDIKNKSELLLTSNPVHKMIPVLIHNGKPICESQIILQYIDEVFPGTGPTLLPADPYDRAIARFWAAYIDDKLLSSWWEWYKAKTEEDKAEKMKKTLVAVEHLEAALKECSKGKPFFGGDGVGFLDFTLGGFVPWAHVGEELYGFRLFDAARSPLLHAWVERFCALDAAKEVLPDADRLLEYAKMRRAQRQLQDQTTGN